MRGDGRTEIRVEFTTFTLYLPITTESRAPNTIVEEDRNVGDLPTKRHPARTAAHSAINAESVFRALGDTTRYAIASILARAPTTSADLARSLKVSKPTITHHVHALRSAGLIRETPAGGSTKLSLSRDTVAALSEAAVGSCSPRPATWRSGRPEAPEQPTAADPAPLLPWNPARFNRAWERIF